MRRERPTRAAAARLAGALDRALAGRRIERVWRPGEACLLLKLDGGERRRLLVEVDPHVVGVALAARWPETPAAPDQATLRLRGALEGARVEAVTLEDDRALAIAVRRGDGPKVLRIQLAGRWPNAAVVDAEGAVVASLVAGRPALDPGAPPLPGGPAAPEVAGDDEAWLEAGAAALLEARARHAADRRRAALTRAARGLQRRLHRTLARVEEDLARAEDADTWRHQGELLKTMLGRIPRGADHVDVPDYTRDDGAPARVPLDPALDPVANMERLFARYRRFRDARALIEARWEAAATRAAAADALLARLTALPPPPQPPEITPPTPHAPARGSLQPPEITSPHPATPTPGQEPPPAAPQPPEITPHRPTTPARGALQPTAIASLRPAGPEPPPGASSPPPPLAAPGETQVVATKGECVADEAGGSARESWEEAEIAIERALRELGWRPPGEGRAAGRREPGRRPYRTFRAADGTAILVGRRARDNDALTVGVARGRDLFFHARDVPGSHVILRVERGREPGQEAMLDAALLAAWHSRARGDTVIDVTWTECKHVRKPRGAPPGRVTVSGGRTLAVRADPERLARLYRDADDVEAPG